MIINVEAILAVPGEHVPGPATIPPIVLLEAPLTKMPLSALERPADPFRLVPISLPSTTLPAVPPPSMPIPSFPLAEITLSRTAGGAADRVSAAWPSIRMPLRLIRSAGAGAALVPIGAGHEVGVALIDEHSCRGHCPRSNCRRRIPCRRRCSRWHRRSRGRRRCFPPAPVPAELVPISPRSRFGLLDRR